MKLVQVNNLIALGGTTTCAAAVCRALPEWRHEVLSLGPVHQPAAEAWFRSRGVTVRRLRRVGAADVADADFVLLNNTPRAGVDGQLGVPTVSWHHSRHARHACGDLTLTVSRHLNRLERSQADVLLQGVADDHDADTRRWSRRRLTDPHFHVGIYGTPNRNKFPPDLPAILAGVDVPEARFELVGGEHLRNRCQRTDLRRRVRILRSAAGAGRRLWRWHVLVAHNAPGVTETFGRCVVEAMMAGCVPVTDARGGPTETVTDGRTGRLCESPDDFIHALRLLADRAHWAAMSRQARDHARQHFSLAAMRRRLLHVFEQALRRRHERRRTA